MFVASTALIDLVCWLLEDLPIKVYTVGNKIALKNERFKKESFILMLLEFRNKLTVKISVNSCSQSKHFHDVRIFTKNKSNEIMSGLRFENIKRDVIRRVKRMK